MTAHTASIVDKSGVRFGMTLSTVRPVAMFGVVTLVAANFGMSTFELNYFITLLSVAGFATFCENVEVAQAADWGVGIGMAA